MFTIGQKVVDQNGKVFVVESISDKDFGSGRSQYLSLRPCFESDSRYRSYVPSDNASELIRNIRTREEARGLRKSYPEIETMCFQSPRERKMYFEKVVLSYVRKVCLNKFILAKDYSVKDVVKII